LKAGIITTDDDQNTSGTKRKAQTSQVNKRKNSSRINDRNNFDI
jgi:hypothetical protein